MVLFLELLCQGIWFSANSQFSIIFINTREGHKGQLGMPNGPLEAEHLLNMQEEPELNSQQHAGKEGHQSSYMNIQSWASEMQLHEVILGPPHA